MVALTASMMSSVSSLPGSPERTVRASLVEAWMTEATTSAPLKPAERAASRSKSMSLGGNEGESGFEQKAPTIQIRGRDGKRSGEQRTVGQARVEVRARDVTPRTQASPSFSETASRNQRSTAPT